MDKTEIGDACRINDILNVKSSAKDARTFSTKRLVETIEGAILLACCEGRFYTTFENMEITEEIEEIFRNRGFCFEVNEGKTKLFW